MPTTLVEPFRFFSLQVARTRRLTPSLVRVTFTGDDLSHFHSDGYDQSLSLFLPHPGQSEPHVPYERGDDWWQSWRELPDEVRAVMRSYTLRELRRPPVGPDEIDIDFVLHHPAGHASAWAARAAAGDRVVLIGPAVADNRAIRFRPPDGTDLVVLWGDETAVPAVSAILESLPPGLRVRAWLEADEASSVRELPTAADAEITWLVRRDSREPARPDRREPARPDHHELTSPTARTRATTGPRSPSAPSAPPNSPRRSARTSGSLSEAGRVKLLRRHFVRERGIDRSRVTFVGYWREGLTEDQVRAQE